MLSSGAFFITGINLSGMINLLDKNKFGTYKRKFKIALRK